MFGPHRSHCGAQSDAARTRPNHVGISLTASRPLVRQPAIALTCSRVRDQPLAHAKPHVRTSRARFNLLLASWVVAERPDSAPPCAWPHRMEDARMKHRLRVGLSRSAAPHLARDPKSVKSQDRTAGSTDVSVYGLAPGPGYFDHELVSLPAGRRAAHDVGLPAPVSSCQPTI